MSYLLFAAGLAVLGLGLAMFLVGLPKNGQIKPYAALGFISELYVFAILITIVVGFGLILNAVL